MATKTKKTKAKSAKLGKRKLAGRTKTKLTKSKTSKPKTASTKSAAVLATKSKPGKTKTNRVTSARTKAASSRPLSKSVPWPIKTREMHNQYMNSAVWNTFKFRDDDVVIATYAKSGTTWTQQIVAQLIFKGADDVHVNRLSPWVDLRLIPPEVIAGLEDQTHRRVVKTHLPVDALVFSPKAKYIFIGRDGRDAAWSIFNHHINATDDYFNDLNNTPGRVGPRIERGADDVREFYSNWFNGDGYPFWPVWENIRSWWAIRKLPNVKLMHFNDMKTDLSGSIKEIAEFLDIKLDSATLAKITEHCTFDYMKANAEKMAPMGGVKWMGGAQTFINKGTNSRWRDILTTTEIAAYDAKAKAELGAACAKWLAQGNGK